MAIWPVVSWGGSIGLPRPMKGLLIALRYHHKAGESGTQSHD
jgi:uncharacterized protein (DUF983 family)